MKIVLFDIECIVEQNGRLLPGVHEMLAAIRSLKDSEGYSPVLALISGSPQAGKGDGGRNVNLLDDLGIGNYFEPIAQRVTFARLVGAIPDSRVLRAAIDKIKRDLPATEVVFISSVRERIEAASHIGIIAVLFEGPVRSLGNIRWFTGLVPAVARLIEFTSADKQRTKPSGSFEGRFQKSLTINQGIAAHTGLVSEANMLKSVQKLTDFGTRFSGSPKISDVTSHIFKEFVAHGYVPHSEVSFQPFGRLCNQDQRNVLCTHAGTGNGLILVCAHYDSITFRPQDPMVSAPGADDNASGVAAVLEMARILKNVSLKKSVLFAAFGGEEQNFVGSSYCRDLAVQDKWPIDVVINLDMIAVNPPLKPFRVFVEFDQDDPPNNNAASKTFAQVMRQAAADYAPKLEIHANKLQRSDYMPFQAAEFPCIGANHYSGASGYHNISDTIDTLNFPYMTEVTKMVLGTIITIGQT